MRFVKKKKEREESTERGESEVGVVVVNVHTRE